VIKKIGRKFKGKGGKEEGAKATDGPIDKDNKDDAAKRVHLAVTDANAILDKAKDEQDAKKKVAKLKKKYGLKSIALLPTGPNQFQPFATINPEEKGAKKRLPSQDEYETLVYKALKRLGDKVFGGYKQEEYESGKPYQSVVDDRKAAGVSESDKDKEDKAVLDELNKKKEEEAKREATGVYRELKIAQGKYSVAAMAQRIPNNTFGVNGTKFFVNQTFNNYIYPNDEVVEKGGSEYYSNGEVAPRSKTNDPLGSYKIGPFLNTLAGATGPEVLKKSNHAFAKYDYDSKQDIATVRGFLEQFPNTIDRYPRSALFLGAFLAEPSRHTVANITHILATRNPRPDFFGKQAYQAEGQLSMTGGGTNPSDIEGKGKKVDTRLDHGGKLVPQKVTDKDIASVRQDKGLDRQLYKVYKTNYAKLPGSEEQILTGMAGKILKRMKYKRPPNM
jgi:hypothetical protein